MQDLVAVGVPDAGHEGLVAQQVLELARMAPDPVPPHVDGECRVVGIGADLVGGEAGHGPVRSRRQHVHLAHLGRVAIADLGGRIVARHPRRAPGPRGEGRLRARDACPRAQRDDDGGLGRPLDGRVRRQLEAAGQHRVDDDRVALEVDHEELAPPADTSDPLAHERLELRGRAPHRQRARGFDEADRPSPQGGVERLGDHGQIGQFGHGRAIVADCGALKPCARLSRPLEAWTSEERNQAPATRRSGPRSSITTDPPPTVSATA